MSRQPKGRVTISKGYDGWYYAWPTVGRNPDGTPKQKKIRRRDAALVKIALDQLAESMKVGSGIAVKIETYGQWLDHWLENVIRNGTKPRSYNTWRTYESQCRLYVKPALGGWKLKGTRNRLEPEHVEELFSKLPKRLSASYRLHMFRVIDGSLKHAMMKGKADRNVCDMIETPETPDEPVTSMTMGEATAFVAAAAADEDGVRYLVGILLGPRQGEALGLRWSTLSLDPPAPDEPYLRVRTQVQRRTWEHGCDDPVVCVQTLTDERGRPKVVCRTRKCPPRYTHGCAVPCGKKLAHFCPKRRVVKGACSTHKTTTGGPKKCPPLCPPKCAGHARHCPDRTGGGLLEVDLKARRADEKVPLGALLTELLRQERERQQRRYADFHMKWDPAGFVFQGAELGKPRDPRRDYDGYQKIRAAAGLAPGRSHVARHTAASMMTAVGTDIRVIQNLLGHRKITTTQIYTDVAMDIKREAVDKVAAALFDGDLAALLGSSAVARKVVSNAFQPVPMQPGNTA